MVSNHLTSPRCSGGFLQRKTSSSSSSSETDISLLSIGGWSSAAHYDLPLAPPLALGLLDLRVQVSAPLGFGYSVSLPISGGSPMLAVADDWLQGDGGPGLLGPS